MGQPLDDCGSRGAVIGVQEIEQGTGGGEPDRGRSRVVTVVLEDLAGFPDEVADAGGGDLQQVREDVHGAGLPLVEKSEQKARGVAEQRPGPRVPRWVAGTGRRAAGCTAAGPGPPTRSTPMPTPSRSVWEPCAGGAPGLLTPGLLNRSTIRKEIHPSRQSAGDAKGPQAPADGVRAAWMAARTLGSFNDPAT